MRTFELRKLENAPKSMRWMVMCNGKAYAGFSTKKVAKEAMEIIEEIFPGKTFQSYVRNDAVVEKAQWNQVAIADFSKNADAARQIRNITQEILERIKEQ